LYVLLASAQDQNDSIVGKYEIIPTRIGILIRSNKRRDKNIEEI